MLIDHIATLCNTLAGGIALLVGGILLLLSPLSGVGIILTLIGGALTAVSALAILGAVIECLVKLIMTFYEDY